MNAAKRKPRRHYYGEEAQPLTNEEQAAHNLRMAQARAGSYDFSNTLVKAPKKAKPTRA